MHPRLRVVAVGGEERRLADETRGEADGERREGALGAGLGPDERPGEAAQSGRHDQEPRRVGEDHRVVARPEQDPLRIPREVEDAAVVAEHPLRAEGEARDERQPERDEGQPEAARDAAHAPALDDERRREEDHRQDDVLHARERRQPGHGEEEGLAAPRRPVERAHAGQHGGQHQRVRDRVGEHRRRVRQTGPGERQRGDAERGAPVEADVAGERVGRDRGERHGERVQALREPVGELRVAGQPERRGEERLEDRREGGRHAADARQPGGRDPVGERRVDVLVGQVRRRHVHRGEQPARREGDADERPEDGLRGEREDPRPRERRRGRGGRRGGVDCHAVAIGSGAGSLKAFASAAPTRHDRGSGKRGGKR